MRWPRWYLRFCGWVDRLGYSDAPAPAARPTPPIVVADRTYDRRPMLRNDPALRTRYIKHSDIPVGPILSRSPMPETERTRKDQERRGQVWTRFDRKAR